MQGHEPGGANEAEGEDEDGGFDLSLVRDYLGYAWRAARLHRLLVAAVFVGVIAFAYGALRVLPKSYHVETRLLAQRDAMPHGNSYGNDPLKGAADIVLGYDHLTSLVKQLDLTTWWTTHLAPAQVLKAKVTGLFGRKPTEDEQVRTLIEILTQKLTVNQGDNTMTLLLDWPNGEMAARILDTAEQNFLEKRHVLEIATIAESISILEEHATRVRKEIYDMIPPDQRDTKAGAADDVAGAAAPKTPTAAAPSAPRRSGSHRRPEFDAELARQKVMIETKQRAISDLEDFRQRRVNELQANLAEQKAKYTEEHPIIVGIEQNIAAFSKESPQVAALRDDVKTLQDAYNRMAKEAEDSDSSPGEGRAATAGAAPASPAAANDPVLILPQRENRDPTTEAQISYSLANYSKIRGDIDAARMDLDFAQAAFRHRYSVVLPAEPPRGPTKPKVPLIMAGAVIAAFIFGVLAAVAVELRSGRLVNRWQVERLLKLPVLGELQLPGGTPPKEDQG
ncbi:MAG TPA: hypothetical protein VH062_30905 [Polyangiaceae bacterium]|jgi:hypothetical protein|nr:hypothetical protein [Polyangiaceae bacterium]